jgi:hypothetical protein
MHVPGRASPRHMKGKQVALTMYLAPNKYWLLKAMSRRSGVSMQQLLRTALDQVLIEEHRAAQPYRRDGVSASARGLRAYPGRGAS